LIFRTTFTSSGTGCRRGAIFLRRCNRIIGIEEDTRGIVIKTTDIHLPRRIGEGVKRALHGDIETNCEESGYFVRMNWTPAT